MYVHNGRILNKYELVTRKRTINGIQNSRYYFKTKEDAELYLRFLLQEEGERQIDNFLKSKRHHQWEKEEYQDFKESIDWETLRKAVKKIRVMKETEFVEIKGKK